MVTRIERPRSRFCVFCLGISFLAVFVVLLGIGGSAPDVLDVHTSGGSDDTPGVVGFRNGLNFYSNTFELSRENQLFWLDLRLGTEGLDQSSLPRAIDVDDIRVTMSAFDFTDSASVDSADYVVSATQYCRAGAEYCDFFFLFKRDFVDRDVYTVSMTFPDPPEYLETLDVSDHTEPLFDVVSQVTSIDPAFTRFEIGFKYLWFVVTLFVMFCPCGVGFMSALKRQRKDTGVGRTFHQKWTATLLWALLWFDDPFVGATVYTNWAKFFSAVFILSASIFVFLILLFWLCFLSDLRFMQSGDGNQGRGVCYWVPKVVLTFAIGTTVLGGYMYYRFENTLSFDYTGVEDEKKAAEALAVVLGLLLSVYMIWTLLLGLRNCGGLRKLSPSYILLYFITLLACLVAVIGVFVAAYYPYSTSAVAFVGIHGLLNLYIWTLAISFSPVRVAAPGAGGSNSLGVGDKAGPDGGGPSAAVTGTGAGGRRGRGGGEDDDISAWEKPADADFKAVEL